MATPTAPGKPARSETSETIRFLLKLALFVFVLRSFIFSPFSIPSESMLPRLLIGDYLFVSKWNYGYSRWSLPWGVPLIPGRIFASDPVRGDTVVFRSLGPDDHDVIKRVIGLPGDTIQMRAGQLFLNGKAIPKQRIADFIVPLTANFPAEKCEPQFQDVDATAQPICRYPRFRETLPGGRSYEVLDQGNLPIADDTDVYRVPAGDVFLMGDNRDDSADSRFAPPEGMGYIPMERIEGKALVTFWSTDGSAEWLKPWTWPSAARFSRIGHGF
ncbi:S26 family signal peptidase [Sphingomonas sp. Leaf231]|uniref:signal peptidase I n=1 Tax=Sphingomonas sp. Leaf231 TaxID=1736301 RepID=UPI0006F69250|nr:signal peptidase I [Sphingomonas sp. Leaf231]KQN93726.1 S26 family signal peptidase [Sphingomonas sp. Leaf231]